LGSANSFATRERAAVYGKQKTISSVLAVFVRLEALRDFGGGAIRHNKCLLGTGRSDQLVRELGRRLGMRLRSSRATQKPCDTDIFVEFFPVNAFTLAD
jgi:hypothetical protein